MRSFWPRRGWSFCCRRLGRLCLSWGRFTEIASADQLLLTILLVIMHGLDILLIIWAIYWRANKAGVLKNIIRLREAGAAIVINFEPISELISKWRLLGLALCWFRSNCGDEWNCTFFRTYNNCSSWNFSILLFCICCWFGCFSAASETRARIYSVFCTGKIQTPCNFDTTLIFILSLQGWVTTPIWGAGFGSSWACFLCCWSAKWRENDLGCSILLA